MIAYKLTDQNHRTRNSKLFQLGVPVTVPAENNEWELCTNSWIHFYTDPLIAVLMNPAHANFRTPILWECKCEGEMLFEPLKSGCKKLTVLKQLDIPDITLINRIAFGIFCTQEVYKNMVWNTWANNWLNNIDRSKTAAAAANAANAAYATYAANAAYATYAANAAYATYAATAATANAAYAATANAAYVAAYAAANVARVAARAIYAARAAAESKPIDFISLAYKSLTIK